MAKAIMIQGTTSNAGKSLITAGLCRIFMQDGHKTAPFKSQNMALNSYVTSDGLEMGRAQAMQAEAAGIPPDIRMNPILLKPTSDKGSQVIVGGKVVGDMTARAYFEQKTALIPRITEAYDSLAAEFDIIVIEGAGSPAEINLKSCDIVNMGMAKLAKAPVLIVGDINLGGVFAALCGTMLLLEEDERALVKGVIINKFRGDVSILEPGLRQLEEIIHRKTLGVVPYLHLELDDEDSLSERFSRKNPIGLVDIAVIKLPRMSNFTDFNPLEYFDGVSLRYVSRVAELRNPDLIILPGTKNTMADLLWLRQSGLEAEVLKFSADGTPIFGICGGFQMLCERLSDPDNVEHGGELSGLGLLPFSTVFAKEKVRKQISAPLSEVDGIFCGLSGIVCEGYEIHMGQTNSAGNLVQAGNVYGSYIHGFFDKPAVAQTVICALFKAKGLDFSAVSAADIEDFKRTQYDLLAAELRRALDMDAIYKILGEGV